MSIRIGITDGNPEFFRRFREALMGEYPGEFEVYSFKTLAQAVTGIRKFHIRVVLLENALTPNRALTENVPDILPATASFLRLADTMQEEKSWSSEPKGTDLLRSIPVVCRYRSVAEWRDILLQEVEQLEELHGSRGAVKRVKVVSSAKRTPSCKLVVFTSAAGGVGTSSAAVSFAKACDRKKHNVLYLSPDPFSGAEELLDAEGNLYNLEDVLLSLRGQKFEPGAVLTQAVTPVEGRFRTLLPPKDPSCLLDLTGEELITLIDLLGELDLCSMVVLDLTAAVPERLVLPILRAERTVVVTDGRCIANKKTEQFLEWMPRLCGMERWEFMSKICLLYNRYRQGECNLLETEAPIKLGGLKELMPASPLDIAEELSHKKPLDRLYDLLKEGPHGPAL